MASSKQNFALSLEQKNSFINGTEHPLLVAQNTALLKYENIALSIIVQNIIDCQLNTICQGFVS